MRMGLGLTQGGLALGSMSDPLSYLQAHDRNRERPDLWPVRCDGVHWHQATRTCAPPSYREVTLSRSDTSALLFPSFLRVIVHYDNSIAPAITMYCPDCRHRATSFAQPVSTHSNRCDYASQVSQLKAIQDTTRRIAWIGYQGLHRNPSAKSYRSRHSENGHHSVNLRSQRSFYTCATGLEACDWLSQY